VRLSVLEGGIHTNTERPRTAKNLVWKIANVLLCRAVLNNDWKERNQMRNRKQPLQKSEKAEMQQSETKLSFAVAAEIIPSSSICYTPGLVNTAQDLAARSLAVCLRNRVDWKARDRSLAFRCSWIWRTGSVRYVEQIGRQHQRTLEEPPRPKNYVTTPWWGLTRWVPAKPQAFSSKVIPGTEIQCTKYTKVSGINKLTKANKRILL